MFAFLESDHFLVSVDRTEETFLSRYLPPLASSDFHSGGLNLKFFWTDEDFPNLNISCLCDIILLLLFLFT